MHKKTPLALTPAGRHNISKSKVIVSLYGVLVKRKPNGKNMRNQYNFGVHLHNESIHTGDELLSFVIERIAVATGHHVPRPSSREVSLLCPAHDDKTPSLSVKLLQDGTQVLLHCFGGCETSDVLSRIGLKMSDTYLYNKPHDSGYCQPYGVSIIQPSVKLVSGSETLPSITTKDDEEKRLRRQMWPKFRNLEENELLQIAGRYHLPMPTLRILNQTRLIQFAEVKDEDCFCDCWCVSDGNGFNAQAMRLDGKPFGTSEKPLKKKTLCGSVSSYPVGWRILKQCLSYFRPFPEELARCLVLLCEGNTDYAATWCLLFNLGLNGYVIPIGILGANVKPTKEIVEELKDANVLLAFDNDSGKEKNVGQNANECWGEALYNNNSTTRSISTFCFDGFFSGCKDLRDVWDVYRQRPEECAAELKAALSIESKTTEVKHE
ncbi:MAG: hypothetical protein EOM12_02110 [Verrucomicrobiae bacterium]|nr:hypothetical protein [Verrucomicrobiae bacterium]